MRSLKKLALIAIMFLLGGIIMQTMGYIDSPLFAWFTDVELFIQ